MLQDYAYTIQHSESDPSNNYAIPHINDNTHFDINLLYPLFIDHDMAQFPQNSPAFIANVLSFHEPISYSQASQLEGWVDAMQKELDALELNDTWEVTSLLEGHRAIKSKWVCKTTYKPYGSVDRLKSRLVIKGDDQREGKAYKHTFSPVAKLSSVRVLIALATAYKWPLHQLDVNHAFLHGFLDEEIYMRPAEEYTKALVGSTPHSSRT